jgi:hypothetical protein
MSSRKDIFVAIKEELSMEYLKEQLKVKIFTLRKEYMKELKKDGLQGLKMEQSLE